MKKNLFFAFILISVIITGCQKKRNVDIKSMSYWIKNCQVPFTVKFYLDYSYQPSEVTLNWDFGDGTTSSEKEPVHVYTKTGVYVVKLKIVNYKTVVEKSFEIDVSKDKMTPKIDCNYSTTYGKWNAPCQIEFYNLTQYASEYFWDFGDGSGSTDDSPTHIYRNPGTYNVKLHAICQDTTTRVYQITINQPPKRISVDVVSIWLPDMYLNAFFNLYYYLGIHNETPSGLPTIRVGGYPFKWIIGKDLYFFSGDFNTNDDLYFEVWEINNNQGPTYSFGQKIKDLKENFYPDTLNFSGGSGFAAQVILKYKDQ